MYKFNLRAQSLTLVSSNGTQKTYQAVVNLKDLVNANDTIGKDLYEANVRGTLFTGKKPDNKNPTYLGISKTLIDIYNDNSLSHKFYNNNNGSLLICDSINTISPNNYQITISEPYHGIGNGQQTITIASFVNRKYPISDDIMVSVTIMVDYNQNDCKEACEGNNTSNKISKKDIMSNDWSKLYGELLKINYILHYKKDAVVPKGENVINIYETGFYNILNSYHTEKPWITGDSVTDIIDTDSFSTEIILEISYLKKCIDHWFEKNISKYDNSKFDSKRTGYIKNVMITCYKKHHDGILPIDIFFTKCFNVIFGEIKSKSERVTSSYFTSQVNCEILIAKVELALVKDRVSNLKLSMV